VITAKAFAGKHYAVLGLARSGLATVEALLASGARVTAWDDKAKARAKAPDGVALEDFVGGDLTQFDSIVVTPGLPLNRHPIAHRAKEADVEIIGDIELFARARPELPPHKVVGITGTNGKSTTTALIHHILKTAGVPTEMGGNIGLPILAQDPLPEGGVYVLELSSYQIDLTQSLDCDVAVLLNISPDHLDRYDGFEAYAASKARLFAMQSAGTVSVATEQVRDWTDQLPHDPGITIIEALIYSLEFDLAERARWPALQGPHNLQNVAAATFICAELGVAKDCIRSALCSYPGLPHRMERVCEKNGVLFVNDSKATNPTATAPALAAFDKIRWICGGQAKTYYLDECAPHFGHVAKAYTIGDAGEMFASLLSEHMDVAECVTLDEAVRAAASEANPGDTVLLSPACASFDQFRDFEARGDAFRAAVGEL
jgi:UDP-N-acetylmuramoylalanine--D-glutamate ligase